MDSSMAHFQPSAVRAAWDLVKGVIWRWKFKDQIEFLEKLHIKFQNFYLRGLPLARVRSPYLQKMVKRVTGRIAAWHHFEKAILMPCYCSLRKFFRMLELSMLFKLSTSPSKKLVGERLMEKNKHALWTVSVSTCNCAIFNTRQDHSKKEILKTFFASNDRKTSELSALT